MAVLRIFLLNAFYVSSRYTTKCNSNGPLTGREMHDKPSFRPNSGRSVSINVNKTRKHFSRNIHGARCFPMFPIFQHGKYRFQCQLVFSRCKLCLRYTTGNFNENPSMRALSNWMGLFDTPERRTWPPRYRCDAPPTVLWSHTLGARSTCWVHISPEEWNDVKYIWNNSYENCGGRWKWRMIIAVNFPV